MSRTSFAAATVAVAALPCSAQPPKRFMGGPEGARTRVVEDAGRGRSGFQEIADPMFEGAGKHLRRTPRRR
jgi:hypothetical protein